jgi:hypothetical protein
MQTDDAPGYIRGGAGVVDTRWLFRILLGLAIVVVAALVAVLTIQAADKNSRTESLRHRGVPVDVTVTKCLGILSGTGITVTSFQCNGSYVLAGRSYNGLIDGSTTNHAAGDVVKAIADPKHPTSISTASSLATADSSWRTFIGSGLLFVLLVLLVAGALWWARRKSARQLHGAAIVDLTHSTSMPTASLANTDSPRRTLTGPAMFFGLLVLLVAGALWWSRRNSAQRPHDAEALG